MAKGGAVASAVVTALFWAGGGAGAWWCARSALAHFELDLLAAVPALFGYATRQDLRYLGDWKNVVDLQPAGSQQPSLQRAVADELGLYVDKRLQVSAWDDRPLSTDQLAYAALDARLCLDLARALGT